MPRKLTVNLDALIQREDFEAIEGNYFSQAANVGHTMKLVELAPSSIGHMILRKPDFQRETANWSPEKVADLVESFINGDLIPSVILWRSDKSGNHFVIDGAHRLSALIAWAHDDYGDGDKSLRFFEGAIPREQKNAAETTRRLVNEKVGSYGDLTDALAGRISATDEQKRMAMDMNSFAINLQWVLGNAKKAEASFYRINQQATPIDEAELNIIKARRKPNALAARAIIRAGTGHPYWYNFDKEAQERIVAAAKETYSLIFEPIAQDEAKSTDMPIAGGGHSNEGLRMVFDLVNFVNKLEPRMWKEPDEPKKPKGPVKGKEAETLPDDESGEETLKFIRSTKRAVSVITGNSPGSLGLHPRVYFYSATGRFQSSAFLATVEFIQELKDKGLLGQFTNHRDSFEEFLVRHKNFLNQIVRRYGAGEKSVGHILTLYRISFSLIRHTEEDATVIAELKKEKALQNTLKEKSEEDLEYGRNFSKPTKDSIYLREQLASASRCGLCNARLTFRSSTIDHIERKADGGTGAPINGQPTHPYCNSTYKG